MSISSLSADDEQERILDRINALFTLLATRPAVANVYNSYFERVGTLATCSILDLMECVFLKWSHSSGFNGKITLLHWENRKRKSKFQQVNSDHCAELMGREWEGGDKVEKEKRVIRATSNVVYTYFNGLSPWPILNASTARRACVDFFGVDGSEKVSGLHTARLQLFNQTLISSFTRYLKELFATEEVGAVNLNIVSYFVFRPLKCWK